MFAALLGAPVRLLPLSLQARAVEPVLARVFRSRIDSGDLDFLHDAVIGIMVTDMALDWRFTLIDRRLRMQPGRSPDVSIRGGLAEFLLLAGRREDPDTLFFERRLMIEGNTELGLQVKNLLDELELEELPAPLRRIVDAGSLLAAGGGIQRSTKARS